MKNFLIVFTIILITLNFGCKKSEDLNLDTGFTTVRMFDDTLASILNSSINIAASTNKVYMTYGVGNSNQITLAGSLFFYPSGYYANLIATDNSGALLWKRTLPKDVIIDDILALNDGSCMAAGYNYKYDPDAYIYLYRFNTAGNNMLNDSIKLPLPPGEVSGYFSYNEVNPIYLKQSSNGNLLIYGSYYSSSGGGTYNGFASEYDLNLNPIWVKKYTKTANQTALNGCIQTNDGGYIFAGGRYNNQTGNGSIILIKTNAVGDTLWTKSFTAGLYPVCNDFIKASNGNHLLSFYTEANNTKQTYIYELSTSGDSLNASTLNISQQLYNTAILSKDDGGVIALMNSKKQPIYNADSPVIQYTSSIVNLDASLQLINNNIIQSQSTNYYNDACITSEGKIAMAGLVQMVGRDYYKPSLLIYK